MNLIDKFRKDILEIKKLKGLHKDKECVIFGGGPSIDNINLENSFFDSKKILTCNFKKKGLKADYHMLHDPLSIMWWQKNNVDLETSNLLFSDIVLSFEERNSSEISKRNKHSALNSSHVRDRWLGDVPIKEYLEQIYLVKEKLKSKNNFYVFESPFWKLRKILQNHKIDIENMISDKWYGSGFLLIECAIYFGFKKIYLSGFDGGQHHNYENHPSQRHYHMKNRNLSFWNQHGERLNYLKEKFKVDIKLINSPNSIYNKFIEEINI